MHTTAFFKNTLYARVLCSTSFYPHRLSSYQCTSAPGQSNIRTSFPRRPSKKTRKRLQRLGLSYQVHEPYLPRRKKRPCKHLSAVKTKPLALHTNLVYVNPTLVGSSSAQINVAGSGGCADTSNSLRHHVAVETSLNDTVSVAVSEWPDFLQSEVQVKTPTKITSSVCKGQAQKRSYQ